MNTVVASRRARLAAIARTRARPERSPAAAEQTRESPVDLANVLGGEECRTSRGTHWQIVTETPAPPGSQRASEILAGFFPGLDPRERSWLFFDLETCGFSGTPLMLAGLLDLTGPGSSMCRVTQFLARNYAEEQSVLEAFLESLGPEPFLVSFNGKSYDIPFTRDRAHRFSLVPPSPQAHLDLLHVARRRWKGRFPNFRLTTLEAQISGITRHADVSGSQVPERFHRFARVRDPRVVAGVLRHNRRDLLTLVDILLAIA